MCRENELSRGTIFSVADSRDLATREITEFARHRRLIVALRSDYIGVFADDSSDKLILPF